MEIEDQVCSLELAKKLKELGVKQKSLFWHISFRNESSPKEQWGNVYNNLLNQDEKNHYKKRSYLKDKKYYSAFTVAELGEMLPSSIKSYYWLKIINWNEYELSYEDDNFHVIAEIQDNNEANARAKMIIHLIENNLINVSKNP